MAAELNEIEKQLVQQCQKIALERKKFDEERAELVEEQRLVREAARKLEASQSQRIQVRSGTIGSLNEFNMDDSWTMWMERFEHCAIINNVDEARKISLFVVLIGPQAYAVLRRLCIPELPADKSIVELDEIMKNYLESTPSRIAQRQKFEECKQSEGQDIEQYLAVLKDLSMNCDFGKNLKSRLRDQFVSGLHSAAIKKRLLGEPNLNYLRAVELATALESAIKSRNSQQPSIRSILDLPDKILVKIILHFDANQRLALGKSCQRFNDLVFGNEELLRNLDFTSAGFRPSDSDLQKYFNDEKTYKKIFRINAIDLDEPYCLSSLIGKAVNLVELNIRNRLEFDSIEELSGFLKPLVHLKRLSVNCPSLSMETLKDYDNQNWTQVSNEPLSRLTYLSVEIVEFTNQFRLLLQLCQQLEELRIIISCVIRAHVLESPLRQEHLKLRNLKLVQLRGYVNLKAIKTDIMCIVPDSAQWTVFHPADQWNPRLYLERNVEVCPELSRVKQMPLRNYATNLTDKSWDLVCNKLLSEVVRVTHEDAPEKFCCLPVFGLVRDGLSRVLKIDEIKKLLKDPGHQISILYIEHVIERNCDVHLLASAFPNLTSLHLSEMSNKNSMSPPGNIQPLHRRLRRKGSLASGGDNDARNTASSFKLLVENTPRLKVLKIEPSHQMIKIKPEDWDSDALYLISGWKNLTVIYLSGIPIPDGKFLIDIGRECKKLEEVTLRNLGPNEYHDYESELFQMLQHCKNLRKLSISDMSLRHLSEMFNILSNCSRLAGLRLWFETKKCDLLELTSSVENMLRKCQELTQFSTYSRAKWYKDWVDRDVRRIISESNRRIVHEWFLSDLS